MSNDSKPMVNFRGRMMPGRLATPQETERLWDERAGQRLLVALREFQVDGAYGKVPGNAVALTDILVAFLRSGRTELSTAQQGPVVGAMQAAFDLGYLCGKENRADTT